MEQLRELQTIITNIVQKLVALPDNLDSLLTLQRELRAAWTEFQAKATAAREEAQPGEELEELEQLITQMQPQLKALPQQLRPRRQKQANQRKYQGS